MICKNSNMVGTFDEILFSILNEDRTKILLTKSFFRDEWTCNITEEMERLSEGQSIEIQLPDGSVRNFIIVKRKYDNYNGDFGRGYMIHYHLA